MQNETTPPDDTAPERLAALACQTDRSGATDGAVFGDFVRRYFASTAPDIRRLKSPPALLDIAARHWRLLQRRAAGALTLDLQPAAGAAALASLQTVKEDLPFLVDSVALCIRNAGARIDWMVHPLMTVRRDAEGRLIAITDDAGGTDRESLIHVEFDPLADAEAYAHLWQTLEETLTDLTAVVADYPAMRRRLQETVAALRQVPPGADASEFEEACALLEWLDDRHFTFLGYQASDVVPGNGGRVLRPRLESGLGLLRADSGLARADLIAPQSELDRYADSPRVVIITKTAQRSPIHKPVEMDVVSLRRFDAEGQPVGTLRFVGLFSSEVYFDRPRHIPVVRRKAEAVIRRAGFPPNSHDDKRLRDILHELPRDELFQFGDEALFRTCMAIHALQEHHPLRVFMRRDRYGRFYSCLVYLPPDQYSHELSQRLSETLKAAFESDRIDQQVEVLLSGQTRIHFVVHTVPGTEVDFDERALEARLVAASRTWRDQLRDSLRRRDPALAARFADAFPLSCAEHAGPDEAAADAAVLDRLSATQPMLPTLRLEPSEVGGAVLKLYVRGEPAALSDVLPMLKHFGLRALRQEPIEVRPADGTALWIQRFELDAEPGGAAPTSTAHFEPAFLAVWRGDAENDGLNRLVLGAGLDVRPIALLRAVCKYLIQTGLPFSRAYMTGLLAEYAPIAADLVQLFDARLDPDRSAETRGRQVDEIDARINAALEAVTSLDADRVLRAFVSVIRGCLRTNYFQTDASGAPKAWISLKLDSGAISELPQPRPWVETWVYSPLVEGIHLRGGPVARGGLRWSDRTHDFRTEVLGLMKAQMVKNAVIVPVGAKGGFVLKQAPDPRDREAWMAAGVAGYRTFLRGLLDVTDNRVDAAVVTPARVVRHDDDDPYLVVAADKGTATFSDIANGLAGDYDYWLGDAFASGGSAGYDHKKMGITARGAWESVKAHFRELGLDTQRQAFTCVGIGDMSGDVFGNGMLLSPHLRLVAAFDHRHIFIDPNPDAETSAAERRRLFALPRSSWDDYDRTRLSEGGGVWPRSVKHIRLSEAARRVLAVDAEVLTPLQLIRAILCAPVDLLWNGGIGTYVKAHHQSNEEVGDRGNDAVRIDARMLRCRVVGEGGNLGFTQAARIEYALSGGRINTDAIDNAGGVHTSDREVNLKIPLNQLMRDGSLTRAERDPLLASFTDEIAEVVLADNRLQALALSLQRLDAGRRLDDHLELLRMLERDGLVDRALEALPDEDTIRERRAAGEGLMRPELAVLMAHTKLSLKTAAVESDLPDDPALTPLLLSYFPVPLVARFRTTLADHRLRREIIANIAANEAVNRMGLAFIHQQADDHGLSRAQMLKGYVIARGVFAGDHYWNAIEACVGDLKVDTFYRLLALPTGLLKHGALWFANSAWVRRPIDEATRRFAAPIAEIARWLPGILPAGYRDNWQQVVDELCAEHVPQALAESLASSRALGGGPDIAELAEAAAVSLQEAATVYYFCGERFGMLWLYAAINDLPTNGRWQALARVNLRDDAYRIHRQLAGRVLQHPGETPQARLDHWYEASRAKVELSERRLREVRAAGTPDFMAMAVAVREIRKLRLL